MSKYLLAKIVIGTGMLLILLGGLLLLAGKIPGMGKLPGDVYINKKNSTFSFPLTTCILISLFLSILFYLLFKR